MNILNLILLTSVFIISTQLYTSQAGPLLGSLAREAAKVIGQASANSPKPILNFFKMNLRSNSKGIVRNTEKGFYFKIYFYYSLLKYLFFVLVKFQRSMPIVRRFIIAKKLA